MSVDGTEVVAVADVDRPRLEVGVEEAERLVVALGVHSGVEIANCNVGACS